MDKLGFTYYNELPVSEKPTTQEILFSLTGKQKTLILNGFVKKIKPEILQYRIKVRNAEEVVKHLYGKIIEIEAKSRLLMRGEVVITPAEIEVKTGKEIPAVYNTPPSTSTQLKNAIKVEFKNDFTESQIVAILTEMIKHSKYLGNGTWNYYKEQIKL